MQTVTTLKLKLMAQIAPGNDEEFLRLLQEADDRLLEFGRWKWTRNRIMLTVVEGYLALDADAAPSISADSSAGDIFRYVTLSPNYVGIVGARLEASGADIHGEEFEFAQGGRGNVTIGDGGEELIDNGTVDVTDGETTETRRCYKVTGGIEVGTLIVALAHYAPAVLYDPDTTDDSDIPLNGTDVPRCPDLAALKLTMLAIIQEEASNPPLSAQYMAFAHRGLDSKNAAARGGARTVPNYHPNGPGVRRHTQFY